MRKYIPIGVFLLFIVVALLWHNLMRENGGAAPESSGENHAESTASDMPSADGTTSGGSTAGDSVAERVSLSVSVGGVGAVSVPDPKTTGAAVEIALPDEKMQEEGVAYFQTDLSFAGFSKPVYVTAFALGARDESDDSGATVRYLRTGKVKGARGSMLALLVSDPEEREADESMGFWYIDASHYLLVLDYGRHRFYRAPTSFFPHDKWNKMIRFTEMTGDGENEIMIKHCYNNSYSFAVYHFSRETGELAEVCSDETLDSQKAFSGRLEDQYRVVMEYPEIGYSETISMLDAGYKTYMLEKSGAKEDVEGECRFVRLWNNGRLRKKRVDKNTVFLYTIDRVSVEDGSPFGFQQPLLMQMQWVCVGHRSEGIGRLYTYARWNEDAGRFEFAKAVFDLNKWTYH